MIQHGFIKRDLSPDHTTTKNHKKWKLNTRKLCKYSETSITRNNGVIFSCMDQEKCCLLNFTTQRKTYLFFQVLV